MYDCFCLSDVEKDSSAGMEETVEKVKKLIGEPRNYGPTPEEKAEIDRRTLEERVSSIITISLRAVYSSTKSLLPLNNYAMMNVYMRH